MKSYYFGALAALLILSGCSKARIEGRVVDMFNKPLAGATASVKGTQYTTTTDSDGEYSLEYVPGDFEVVVSKAGYTDSTSTFKLATKEEVPVAEVMLYLMPAEKGIFLLKATAAGDSLVPIPLAKTFYEKRTIGRSYYNQQLEEVWYVDGNESNSLTLPITQDSLTFLDNDGLSQVLLANAYATEGLYDLVTRRSGMGGMGLFAGDYNYQMNKIPFRVIPLRQGMYLWKCKLEEGSYTFATFTKDGRNPVKGPLYWIQVQ